MVQALIAKNQLTPQKIMVISLYPLNPLLERYELSDGVYDLLFTYFELSKGQEVLHSKFGVHANSYEYFIAILS